MAHDIGKLVMIGFDGTESTPELRSFIKDEGIGGIILFRRNIVSQAQTKRLVERLKDEVDGDLLVAIDQEGGRVQRLPDSFGIFPSMAEVAKMAIERDDAGAAYEAGERIAHALRPIGVGWDFAPVLDVSTNPFNPIIGDRAFSEDPDFVGELAVQFMKGLMEGGIVACGKHFPGHGDTDIDSHVELPTLPHTRKRFEVCEWKPFRTAIKAGLPSIMTGHLMAPHLDPELPASISPTITTDILRGELGFKGVIVTDDLVMAGIADYMLVSEAAVASIAAGADMIIISQDPAKQRESLDALKKATDNSTLPANRLSESRTRLSKMKSL